MASGSTVLFLGNLIWTCTPLIGVDCDVFNPFSKGNLLFFFSLLTAFISSSTYIKHHVSIIGGGGANMIKLTRINRRPNVGLPSWDFDSNDDEEDLLGLMKSLLDVGSTNMVVWRVEV